MLLSKDGDTLGGEYWDWSQSLFSPNNDQAESEDDVDDEADDVVEDGTDDGADVQPDSKNLVHDVYMYDDGAPVWRSTIEVLGKN